MAVGAPLVAILIIVFIGALIAELAGDYVERLVSWYRNHGTKIIGFVSGLIAAVAGVGGIIPEAHLKYYMATIAVCTFLRGYENSQRNSQ